MGGTPWAGMAEQRPCWGAVDAVGKSGIAPLKKTPLSELSLQGIFKQPDATACSSAFLGRRLRQAPG